MNRGASGNLAGILVLLSLVSGVGAQAQEPKSQQVLTPLPQKAPVFRDQALRELVPSDPSKRSAIEVEELVSKPDMPPPNRYRPVLKDLPPSFVLQSYARFRGNYDITGLDVGRRLSHSEPAKVLLNSFILDKKPMGLGHIEEAEAGDKVASVGQMVYVRMRNETRAGQRYLVVAVKGPVKDIKRQDGSVPTIVEVGGTVEITGRDETARGLYRALVTSSINPVTAGSILIEEEVPRVSFTAVGQLKNIRAQVIGGEFDATRTLLGESATIYIDAGSQEGLSVGDLLAIQGRRRERKTRTQFPGSLKPVGLIKVVKVERTVATAIVVDADDEIMTGDWTGGEPPSSKRVATGSMRIDDEPVQSKKDIDILEDEIDLLDIED